MQREGVCTQYLVAAQIGRVTDHIDAVELRLDDGVIDGSADVVRVAQHKGQSVSATVQPIRAHHDIGGSTKHDSVRSQTLELVVLDNRAAGILTDDAHRCPAIYAVTPQGGARPHYMNRGFV